MRANQWKIIVLIFTLPLVSACGGGSSDSSGNAQGTTSSSSSSMSSSSSSQSPTQTVITSADQTVSSSSPTFNFKSLVTLDFTGQSNLIGQKITVAQITDSNLDSVSSWSKPYLNATFADGTNIEIIIPTAPEKPIAISLPLGTTFDDSTRSTVFAYDLVGDEGDGGDSLVQLETASDVKTNVVSALLPAEFFSQDSKGNFVAFIKLGTVTNLQTPATNVGIKARSFSATQIDLSLPCPTESLHYCLETSRYNPARVLSGKRARHPGTDFNAAIGTLINLPAGGSIVDSLASFNNAPHSADHYQDCALSDGTPLTASALTDELKSYCAGYGGKRGFYIVVNYGSYLIQVMHLSSIKGCLKTIDSNCIIKSGSTGAALTHGPHLHYELFVPADNDCKGATGACFKGWDRVDAFPHMLYELQNQFEKVGQDNVTIQNTNGPNHLEVTAIDLNSTPLESNVGNANENGGSPPNGLVGSGLPNYEPSRKVCFGSTSFDVKLPPPDGQKTFEGPNGLVCAAWGTKILANSVVPPPTSGRPNPSYVETSPPYTKTGNFALVASVLYFDSLYRDGSVPSIANEPAMAHPTGVDYVNP